MDHKRDYSELEKNLGYSFRDPELLRHALTHSSYSYERKQKETACNERLEFLGDAVLEQISSEYLYRNFPELPEGKLTKIRASLVCEEALCEAAHAIALGDFLLLGRGEDQNGGRQRPSVLSDAFEAVLGAVYLDGGQASAKAMVERFCMRDIERHVRFHDCKSSLQELTQQDHGTLPEYRLVSEAGPQHKKEFKVAVFINGKAVAEGVGPSKKAAEKEAAYQALLLLTKGNSACI